MGLYLEPQDGKKEWLEANGHRETATMGFSNIDYNNTPEDQVLICLVDNGMFYAAAVAFSEDEFKAFDAPDGRPKLWYYVSKEKAKMVSPMWNTYMKDK